MIDLDAFERSITVGAAVLCDAPLAAAFVRAVRAADTIETLIEVSPPDDNEDRAALAELQAALAPFRKERTL